MFNYLKKLFTKNSELKTLNECLTFKGQKSIYTKHEHTNCDAEVTKISLDDNCIVLQFISPSHGKTVNQYWKELKYGDKRVWYTK